MRTPSSLRALTRQYTPGKSSVADSTGRSLTVMTSALAGAPANAMDARRTPARRIDVRRRVRRGIPSAYRSELEAMRGASRPLLPRERSVRGRRVLAGDERVELGVE